MFFYANPKVNVKKILDSLHVAEIESRTIRFAETEDGKFTIRYYGNSNVQTLVNGGGKCIPEVVYFNKNILIQRFVNCDKPKMKSNKSAWVLDFAKAMVEFHNIPVEFKKKKFPRRMENRCKIKLIKKWSDYNPEGIIMIEPLFSFMETYEPRDVNYTLSHNDLHMENIIRCSQTGEVYLLDYENMSIFSNCFNVAFAELLFNESDFGIFLRFYKMHIDTKEYESELAKFYYRTLRDLSILVTGGLSKEDAYNRLVQSSKNL